MLGSTFPCPVDGTPVHIKVNPPSISSVFPEKLLVPIHTLGWCEPLFEFSVLRENITHWPNQVMNLGLSSWSSAYLPFKSIMNNLKQSAKLQLTKLFILWSFSLPQLRWKPFDIPPEGSNIDFTQVCELWHLLSFIHQLMHNELRADCI